MSNQNNEEKIRQKLLEMQKAREGNTIGVIIFDRNKLMETVKKILHSGNSIDINKTIEGLQRCSTDIDGELIKYSDAKKNILDAIELLSVLSKDPNVIISIKIKDPGFFQNVRYESLACDDGFDEIRILSESIDKHAIHMIDLTKRYTIIQMKYDNGMIINYNIRYNLSNINFDTNVVEGSFSLTR